MSRRLRIVEITPTLGVGGAERVVVHLARHLDRAQFEVSVVSLYDRLGTHLERELDAEGVPTAYLGKARGFDARMYSRLWSTFRRLKPDVVHTHNNSLRYVYPLRVLGAAPRIVHTVHNLAEHEVDAPGRLLQRVAFRYGVEPVAIGEAVATSIQRLYGLRPRWSIPNGIPVEHYRRSGDVRERTRDALSISPDARVVISVARFSRQKNTQALIEAFASSGLPAKGGHLLLVGDGAERSALELAVQRLGLGPKVRFLGVRSDVPDLLAAADIFAISSSWEGNPLSVLEAMSAGLPVLAFSVGCLPELVTADCGILVPGSSSEGLGAALKRMVESPSMLPTLAAGALRRAHEHFDVRVMSAAYERVFRESL
ncbi:glycosyl transferase group 1 [Anaeromyxobacter dehalogenans 2CP-1]|uniref:Glycosyl transferase group 1 n=1 Tax=Anaeromyxobacter dehalogenans (strain ATCC BAA-258 / DSM 21875 / 2CP-1) TaxID=455488 RepID=B8JCN6_ANAD2|nr:glycosyltransferase [Anaeromyxobacter dehalogenans]ACL67756.1 glycosyl transferase group 1 [Anaeromyxobacter dehalogenans 2CP-1]